MSTLKSLKEKNIMILNSLLEVLGKFNNGQVWLINSHGVLTHTYPPDIKISLTKHFRYKDVLSGQVVSQRINREYFKESMLLIGIPSGCQVKKLNTDCWSLLRLQVLKR